jgi:hypothetical protein
MSQHEKDCVEYLLSGYKTAGREGASYKNIPIELLPCVRQYFRAQGEKIRVRYRGPRNNPLDLRYRTHRMQDCAKQFANRFSIYVE